MATSATSATEFNVNQLVTLAYQMSGMTNPTAGDLLLGRQVLFLGLHALTNLGVVLRQRERVGLTLTTGQAYVDCASDTLTVEEGATLRSSDGVSDIPITLYPISQYQELPNKTTTGQPSFYSPEQQPAGGWRIFLYPTPSSDWTSLTITRTRRPRDVDTGAETIDFDPRWHLTIVNFLQGKLSRAKGRRDLATEMMIEFDTELERALNNETERGGGMLVADSTPWDR